MNPQQKQDKLRRRINSKTYFLLTISCSDLVLLSGPVHNYISRIYVLLWLKLIKLITVSTYARRWVWENNFLIFSFFRKQNRYQDPSESLFCITGVSLVIQTCIVVPLSFQPISNPTRVERNKTQFPPHKTAAEGGRKKEWGRMSHETDHNQRLHNFHRLSSFFWSVFINWNVLNFLQVNWKPFSVSETIRGYGDAGIVFTKQ